MLHKQQIFVYRLFLFIKFFLIAVESDLKSDLFVFVTFLFIFISFLIMV
jgi:hypothetical protein